MRPIDADAILQEVEDLTKSPWFHWGENTYRVQFLARKEAVEIVRDLCVRNAPTIDVIPIKWLKAQIAPYKGDISDLGKGAHNATIKNLIYKWQKEQEAR